MKKCRPVVKEPSGGTLLFRFALPARSASLPSLGLLIKLLTLPRRCLHGVHLSHPHTAFAFSSLCLGAACTGCIVPPARSALTSARFASALPARGASECRSVQVVNDGALPRRGLHGVHRPRTCRRSRSDCFASALPARGASWGRVFDRIPIFLCLGAACTGCIGKSR